MISIRSNTKTENRNLLTNQRQGNVIKAITLKVQNLRLRLKHREQYSGGNIQITTPINMLITSTTARCKHLTFSLTLNHPQENNNADSSNISFR